MSSPAEQFILRFVQESNAIEDLSVSDRDLASSWQRGTGQMGAMKDMLQLAHRRARLTIEHVSHWQAAITREQLQYGHWIAEEHIGCLRTRNMSMGGRRFAAPESIAPAVSELLAKANVALASGSDDGLELAAWTHWRFELIHPFVDGNGRTGRLLALYILGTAGARPVLFTAGDRASCYFRAFNPENADAMVSYFREHQLAEDPLASAAPIAWDSVPTDPEV